MTERTHAFLAARYYEYLTRQFGQQGKAAFVHADRKSTRLNSSHSV